MSIDLVLRYDGARVNDFGEKAIAGGSCDLEAGTKGALRFMLPPGHPYARNDSFAKKDPLREVTLSEVYADGTEYEMFRGWVTETSLDKDLVLTVECEGMLAYLERTVVRPYSCRPLADLPADCEVINGDPFEWLLSRHAENGGQEMAFEMGHNSNHDKVPAGTSWNTTWEEMNEKFCAGKDRYLHARQEGGRRYLDLLDGGAGEGTQAIVVGENVIEMDLDVGSRDEVTAIIPRSMKDDSYQEERGERMGRNEFGIEGADVGIITGSCSNCVVEGDRVVNWDMVRTYGYREEKRDYEADSPETLAYMAAADLDPASLEDRDVRAFDITAYDLHNLNPAIQPIRILDWTEVFIRADGLVEGDAKGRLVFHGWLPCLKMHVDLTDPAASTYHFGDLQETLTRKSALRIGMLKRGNGTLVRRTDPIPWNNERVWNYAESIPPEIDKAKEDLEDQIGEATDQWSQHLADQFDEKTREWYEHLDESVGDVSKEVAQGREELLKKLEETEGKWSDELGHIGDDVDSLKGKVDTNHTTLLAGLKDLAMSSQRTFFGYCTGSGSARVVTDIREPGNERFALVEGAVIDVKFTFACDSYLTLNVGGTGARAVVTNGASVGVWQAGQVVRLLYDGTNWQNCSVDIYGRSVTVGNPAQANFHAEDMAFGLRLGSDYYVKGGTTGVTVGLESKPHVDIGSSYVDIVRPSGQGYVRFGHSSEYSCPSVTSNGSIAVAGDTGHLAIAGGSTFLKSTGDLHLTGRNRIFVGTNGDATHPVVFRSIVVTGNGQNWIAVSASAFGLSDCNGYAWMVTNGDRSAQNFVVTGSAYNPATRGVIFAFNGEVSGQMRLNVIGIYAAFLLMNNDPGMPGPEMAAGDTDDEGVPDAS